MASNNATLQDENGDYSDWIELNNTGTQAVVACLLRGKNRLGSELHTNFSLKISGEYLGLFLSDGSTLADEYSPAFPQQSPTHRIPQFSG